MLSPQPGAECPSPGFPESRTTFVRWILENPPYRGSIPGCFLSRGQHTCLFQPPPDFTEADTLHTYPLKHLPNDLGFFHNHFITRLAASILLADVAIAIRRSG